MDQHDSFSQIIDRRGTYCTQWDFIQDRFGVTDLLPFTISDMDFATAPQIINQIMTRTQHGVFGYSRWKHSDFLNAIQRWFRVQFDTQIETDNIVYGPSVIYMVSQLIQQWSDKGDGVVFHTPAYDAFYKCIEGNQRKVIPCPLDYQDNKWFCNMALLETLLAQPTTRILLLCSPHNPTGKVWTKDELLTIEKLCQRYHVKVISDEIHMDLCWEPSRHIPWSAVSTSTYALFTSASKSFNIPALTGAYGLINDPISRDAYLNQLKNCDGLSSPAIFAILAHICAYTECDEWFHQLRNYLFDNLIYVKKRLDSEFPELNWQIPEATYLAWIDLSALKIDESQLQDKLIYQQKVAIMPGSTYGIESRDFIRMNVGCSRQKLEDGMNRLIQALKSF